MLVRNYSLDGGGFSRSLIRSKRLDHPVNSHLALTEKRAALLK
jgi:hypothetical protein